MLHAISLVSSSPSSSLSVHPPPLSLSPSLSVCTAQRWQSEGLGGFLWQSASPLLAGTGPGACYWLGVWKGSGEVAREERREGERAREEGDWRGWRRGLQLVMKSSLFILRRQSVSGRARGLRGSTAFSACKSVPSVSPLCSALLPRLSACLPQLRDTKRPRD